MDIRVTKNQFRMGRLRIFRSKTVPRMDEGRNGDIVVIDTGIVAEPTSVGLWLRLPLTDERAPPGTFVNGNPGAISEQNSITINSVVVNFTNANDIKTIVDDINSASIPNITANVTGGAVQLNNTASGAITVSDNSLGLYSLDPLVDIDNVGVWVPFGTSSTSEYVTRSIQMFIELPEQKTYTILENAGFGFEIRSITARTASGTITISIQINGIDVIGLSDISITPIPATTNATANRVVEVGDRITLITENNAITVDLSITLTYSYRN